MFLTTYCRHFIFCNPLKMPPEMKLPFHKQQNHRPLGVTLVRVFSLLCLLSAVANGELQPGKDGLGQQLREWEHPSLETPEGVHVALWKPNSLFFQWLIITHELAHGTEYCKLHCIKFIITLFFIYASRIFIQTHTTSFKATGSLVELPRNVAQQQDSLVTKDRTTVPVNDPIQNRYTLKHQNHSNHFQIIAILRTTIFGPKHN